MCSIVSTASPLRITLLSREFPQFRVVVVPLDSRVKEVKKATVLANTAFVVAVMKNNCQPGFGDCKCGIHTEFFPLVLRALNTERRTPQIS
jgi:hypothetical protein